MLFSRLLAVSILCSVWCHAAEEEIPDLTEKPVEKPAHEFEEKPKVVIPPTSSPTSAVTHSVSRIFTVMGANAATRSDIAKLADAVGEQLRAELKEDIPKGVDSVVIIEIHGQLTDDKKKNAFSRQFGKSATDDYYFKLHVHQGGGIEYRDMRVALLEMLILRRTLSDNVTLTEELELVVHPWVIEGLLEVMDWKAEKSDRKAYQQLFDNPSLFSLEKLMEVKRKEIRTMDAVTQRSYRAASGGLMMALLKQPGGRKSMKKFLSVVSLFQGEMSNLLKRNFPEVNKGKKGLRVAWLLQLAEMSMTPLNDSLSIIETEKKLDEILVFRYLDEKGAEQVHSLANYEPILKLEEEQRRKVVNHVARKLITLNYRCYPLYRSMLFTYGTVLNALSQGSDKQVKNVLLNMAAERELVLQSAQRARDYLDWYMINHARGVSGDYSSFDRLEKEMRARELKASDPKLGGYLDGLEKFYQPRAK